MASPADAAARRQAAVAAAAALEPMAGYPNAIISDPVLDAWRATFASQARAAEEELRACGLAAAAFQSASLAAAGATAAASSAAGMLAAAGHQAQHRGLAAGGGLHDLLRPLPVAPGLASGHPGSGEGSGATKNWLQHREEKKSPAEEAAERQRKTKEEKAKKEAEAQEEAERRRCHLHKKPKDSCKFCQRHKEYVTKDQQEKAAAKEKFISTVAKKPGSGQPRSEGSSQGPLELANPKTFGFPPMLQTHIVESTHFKTLMDFQTIEEITHEISGFVESVEPYVQNSTTVPSALFCCAYRLLTMGLTGGQLHRIIESEENPYIRCAGLLYVRFGLAPDQLWSWVGEYVLDDEELRLHIKDESAGSTTIGEYVESLLTQERYFSTVLPRLPIATKRHLEARLAQVPQDRRRTKANKRLMDVYKQRGVRIEACFGDGEWKPGETLELLGEDSSRPKLRVRLEGGDDGGEEEAVVHLGRAILADPRFSSRFSRGGRRSRSRSPAGVDWAREKGKSSAELLEEHRKREHERAVCSSGKEYARRPVSFQVALPMEQGNASKGLVQDETYISASERRSNSRGDRNDHGSRSPEPQPRSREHSIEYQARMRQLFEKYGQARGQSADKRSDIEGPDVMRLG